MEVFDFIIQAILHETKKCNVFFTKETCHIQDSVDEQFDKAVNRLAYLYKYGIFNTYFFKTCISNFANNSAESSKVLDQIHSANVICSLSIGPGIDILALILAFRNIGKTFGKNTSFKIISKNGEWRNSMNAWTSSIQPDLPNSGTFKLVQCNILKTFSTKANSYLTGADVVIMDHTFASPKAKKKAVVKALYNILLVLKPGTLIIIIDTKVKMSYYESLHMFGEFIHGPIEITLEDIPCRESSVQTIGVELKRSGAAYFGIWRKSSLSAILENEEENNSEKHLSLVNVVPSKTKNDSAFYFSSNSLSQQNLPHTSLINKNKYSSDDLDAISNKSSLNPPRFSSFLSQNLQENNWSINEYDNTQNFNEDIKKLVRSLDGLVTQLERFVNLEENGSNCNFVCRRQLHFNCMCYHNFHTVCCKSCMHCRCCATSHCEIKNDSS